MRSHTGSTKSGTRSQPKGVFHRLVLVHSPSEAGTIWVLTRSREIGRAPQGAESIQLADESASRRHAQFEVRGDRVSLADLGSRNGTFVNGRRIEGALALRPGDVVRVGSQLMVFETLPAESIYRGPRQTRRDGSILGESFSLLAALDEVSNAAPQSGPVLLSGETGAGKELFAREVHRLSDRHEGPFVPLNCAALPDALAESILFGHRRGAFTGANEDRKGLFAEANGGTIFLDEIGDMPLALQAILLRVLETKELRAVGDTQLQRLDVRVVAATNVDLEDAVRRKAFREDLLSRLLAFRIHVPSLRERRVDLLRLAATFARKIVSPDSDVGQTLDERRTSSNKSRDSAPDAGLRLASFRHAAEAFTADAAEALLSYGWSRNVRELQQIIEGAAAWAKNTSQAGEPPKIDIRHLPENVLEGYEKRVSSPSVLVTDPDQMPLEFLVHRDSVPSAEQLRVVLRRCEGSVAKVAEFFGKDRKQIYRWMDRYEIAWE